MRLGLATALVVLLGTQTANAEEFTVDVKGEGAVALAIESGVAEHLKAKGHALAQEPGSATFEIEVFEVDGVFVRGELTLDGVPISWQRLCECDVTDAERLTRTAVELVDELIAKQEARRSPPTLVIECRPGGLILYLNRKVALRCGTNEIVPGDHTVVAIKKGYEQTTYVVSIGPGERELLIASPVKIEKSNTLWYVAGGGVVGGAGLAVYGVAHLVGASDDVSGGLRTEKGRSSKTVGGVLVGVGAAAFLGGAVLGGWLYFKDDDDGSGVLGPAPVGDGLGMIWAGSF